MIVRLRGRERERKRENDSIPPLKPFFLFPYISLSLWGWKRKVNDRDVMIHAVCVCHKEGKNSRFQEVEVEKKMECYLWVNRKSPPLPRVWTHLTFFILHEEEDDDSTPNVSLFLLLPSYQFCFFFTLKDRNPIGTGSNESLYLADYDESQHESIRPIRVLSPGTTLFTLWVIFVLVFFSGS